VAQRRIGELEVRPDGTQHLQPGVVTAGAGSARAVHHVQAGQLRQADDASVGGRSPGWNPDLRLELAQ